METEEDGHLPFLDIDIYRKIDGSLGHKVYRKPTHTNLYLQQNSHHHPANKHSVLTSLVHRAKTLCDQDSLPQEMEFLTTVFKMNGYSTQQIRRAMVPTTPTSKNEDKPTANAYLPYTQTTFGRLSRMLAKHNIKSVALPPQEDSQLLATILLARILHEVSERGLLRDEQFGVRPRHSTSLQMARLVERIARNFGEKRLTGAVFLEVDKAFDTVWTDGLI
jgi:hypothetical protein